MIWRFAILTLPILAACNPATTTSGAVTIDPNTSSQLYSDLSIQTEVTPANLPNSGQASYDGYIEVNFTATTAIGALSADVDFGNSSYSMSADQWLELGPTTDTVINGSMTGNGSVATDMVNNTAGITGTLSGQVNGTTVNLTLSGTFTGSGSGNPSGIYGGSESGSTHGARFAME